MRRDHQLLIADTDISKDTNVLHYALMFFLVALIAAVLGMQGVAGLSAEIGYVLVAVSVILLVVSFVLRRPTPPSV